MAVLAGALAACLGVVPWLAVPAHASPSSYYVASGGSDANAGTSLAAPFRTIGKCASVAVAGETCFVRAGTYRETVTPAASGTASAPITYKPYNGESVTISGATPVAGWTRAVSANVPMLLQTAYTTGNCPGLTCSFAAAVAAGRVYKAPASANPALFANQVFVDGAMLPEARWPTYSGNPLLQTKATADQATAGHVIHENNHIDEIPGFWNGGIAHETLGLGWTSWTGTIQSNGGESVTFTPDGDPANSAYFAPFYASTVPNLQTFYLTGVIGALASPGQWFYDSGSGNLFVWLDGNENPASHTVDMKSRNYAFDLSGKSYITVQGFNVTAATITTDAHSTGDVLDGLNMTYVSHYVRIPIPPATVDPQASPQYGHTQDTGVILAGDGNVFENSSVDFSAGNGVAVLGTHITVTNNLIRDTDYGANYTAGIFLQGTNNTITHNTVARTGRDGILILPNIVSPIGEAYQPGNYVGYNDISQAGMLNTDLGGIYVCCNDNQDGSVITHNWVHDVEIKSNRTGSFGYIGAAIYLDQATQFGTIDHNVAWNGGGDALRLNTGGNNQSFGNRVYNNTLAPEGNNDSIGSYSSTTSDMTGTQISNNIFGGATQIGTGASVVTNLPSTTNPAFVNPSAHNYQLQATSPAIYAGTPITGFTPPGDLTPDLGAYPYGVAAWTAGCSMAICANATVDDASASVTYSGTWTHCTSGCDPVAMPYSGTVSSSSTAGSVATISFTGSQVAVHFETGVNANATSSRGLANVSVDGAPAVSIDTVGLYPYPQNGTSDPAGDQALWISPALSSGTHTITITVTGTHDPVSTSPLVSFDRIDVFGS